MSCSQNYKYDTETSFLFNFQYIAAGSEDTDIKLVPKDKSEQESLLSGHQGPILSIDLSIKGLLASSSGDGTIKIWDIAEKKEIKTISGLPKVNTFDSVKSFGKANNIIVIYTGDNL